MKKKLRIGRIFLYVMLIIGALICLMPLYWLIRSALMDMSQIFQRNPIVWIPKPFVWTNFGDALSELPFNLYFTNSAIITFACLVGVVVSSSFCAFAFSRLKWRGRNFWFVCIMSSMMLPYAVTMIPTFIGWQKLGLYGTYYPLIVPAFFGGGAFNIFLLRQFYMTLPKELDEAAIVDGASYPRIWAQIVLPLSHSALIVVGLFAFLNTWNDFLAPLIYCSNDKQYTVALGLQLFKGMYNARWEYLMAASAVAFLPCLIAFALGQKYFIEGIALTGVKG